MYSVLEKHLEQNSLANGYLLSGHIEATKLVDFLKQYGEAHIFSGEIGIEDTRKIKEMAARIPGICKRSFFIIDAEAMSRFVPQAILKTIEESLPNRHFFILSSNPEALPYTLRSRLVELHQPVSRHSENDFLTFRQADHLSKSRIIEETSQDQKKFADFLDGMEMWVMDENKHDFIPKIAKARESAAVFNISRKMCLEYLTHLIR